MTVKEVIETVDALRPNEIAAEDKRKWLYELESRIYEDLYVTHEHEGIGFTDTEKILSDDTTELFIKAPHDEIYILYLCSLIDFYHAEYERYANDNALFEALYESCCRFWNSRHISCVRTEITGSEEELGGKRNNGWYGKCRKVRRYRSLERNASRILAGAVRYGFYRFSCA